MKTFTGFAIAFSFALIILNSCGDNSAKEMNQSNHENNNDQEEVYSMFIGTYTRPQKKEYSHSKGIYHLTMNASGEFSNAKLAAHVNNPSYLDQSDDGKCIFTVSEVARTPEYPTGSLIKLEKLDDKSLRVKDEISSLGQGPCYVDIFGQFALVANYSSGNVAIYEVDPGFVDLEMIQHRGKGADLQRQDGPHAHFAKFIHDERLFLTVDLGIDEVAVRRLDGDPIQSQLVSSVKMTPGAGPRHAVVHPDKPWIYVLNELNSTVTQILFDDERKLTKGESWTTLPSGYKDKSYCADIHLSRDGKYLYASNRGHNSIVVFAVEAESGNLVFVEHVNTGGEWPRNFALTPDDQFLVVANAWTDNLVSFARDKESGKLVLKSKVATPAPTCILFE